jgi:uncharacterized membrane protein YfcA
MEMLTFIAVFATGMIGGFFNTFVGAGSLLSIPVLMIFGLPPHTAIATNRLGVIGSDIAGWYAFHVKRMIDYKAAFVLAVPSLVGAVIGANLILQFNEANLKKVVGVVTLSILILITLNPRAGIEHIKYKLKGSRYLMAVTVSFIVGVYGGFYGAGAGTFLFYILILCFGETFLESAGTHEVANLAFSATAALIFAYNGIIDYTWSAPLFIGSFTGSFASAYYSEKIGNVWLKRLFFAVVLAVVIKLFV